MSGKEGWSKNMEQVRKGIDAFKLESELQTTLIKSAIKRKDYQRAVHHAFGYRAAAQEHMWKLWFYTFWPKWAIVATLILL
jgi:hypothetical protein